MSTKQAFVTSLAVLAGAFNRELSAPAVEGYWIALGELEESDFKTAVSRALRECKFMPAPMELLAFAGKAKNTTADVAEAWQAVRAAIDRNDYTDSVDFGPLVNAVVRNIGGWQYLCDLKIPALDVWARKKFEEIYLAFCDKDPATLHGEPHIGFLKLPPVPIAIGGKFPPKQIEGKRPNSIDLVRQLADLKSDPPNGDVPQ